MTLEERIAEYHMKIVTSKARGSYKGIHKLKNEIKEQHNLTEIQFQELYFQHIKKILDKYK